MLPASSNILETGSEASQCIIYDLPAILRGCSVWGMKDTEEYSKTPGQMSSRGERKGEVRGKEKK